MRFLLSICSSFLRNHAYWPQKKKKRPVSFQQKSIPGQLWKPCHSNGIDELINFGETESVSVLNSLWGFLKCKLGPSHYTTVACGFCSGHSNSSWIGLGCVTARGGWRFLLMPLANLFDAMFMHVTSNVHWEKTHHSAWFLCVLISTGVLMLASAEMSLPVAVLDLSGAFMFSFFTRYCQQCPSAVVAVLYLHVCSLHWQLLLNFLLEFEQLLGEQPQQTQQTWIIL